MYWVFYTTKKESKKHGKINVEYIVIIDKTYNYANKQFIEHNNIIKENDIVFLYDSDTNRYIGWGYLGNKMITEVKSKKKYILLMKPINI